MLHPRFFSHMREPTTLRRRKAVTDSQGLRNGTWRALTGEPWEVFQDIEDIEIGQQWRKRLAEGVEGSTFFIPGLDAHVLQTTDVPG